MLRKRMTTIFFIVIALVLGTVCLRHINPAGAASSAFSKAVVTLYEGGKIVGTWDTVDFGQIHGNVLEFTTTSKTKVRICGTYSIEESR